MPDPGTADRLISNLPAATETFAKPPLFATSVYRKPPLTPHLPVFPPIGNISVNIIYATATRINKPNRYHGGACGQNVFPPANISDFTLTLDYKIEG